MEDDPYAAQAGETPPTEEAPDKPKGGKAPMVGCVTGGCLTPTLLFFGAAASGDVGGPLFWPIIAVPLAAVGVIGGLIYRAIRK